MTLEYFRNYCLGQKGVTEDLPFDQNTLVFKVMGKMFALTDLANFESINLKCDPEKAVELREKYSCVLPGYHMNKKHWNTIELTGEMSDTELLQWTQHSYDLVVSSLPKKVKEELGNLG